MVDPHQHIKLISLASKRREHRQLNGLPCRRLEHIDVRWHAKPKRRALIGNVFLRIVIKPNITAHQSRQLLGDDQTQPSPAILTRDRRIALTKALKQHFLISKRDALTAVLHTYHQIIITVIIKADPHHHITTVGKLNRIANDIGQYLLEA